MKNNDTKMKYIPFINIDSEYWSGGISNLRKIKFIINILQLSPPNINDKFESIALFILKPLL